MHFIRNASIQQKQMLIAMGICTAALFLACAGFVTYDWLAVRREMASLLLVNSDVLGRTCWGALDFKDPKGAEDNLIALKADPHIVSATIFTADAVFFARYSRGGAGAASPLSSRIASTVFEHDRLRAVRPILRGDERLGFIMLESDLSALSERMKRHASIVALVFAVATGVAFFLSARLQRLISGPILDLLQTTRTVAADQNYALRARKESGDELGQLVDGFNEMLAQIQTRDSALHAARDGLEQRVEERTRELQLEIRERKDAEEALVESEERFSGAFEHAPIGVALLSPDGRWIQVNHALCDLVGYSEAELLTGTFQDITHPADLELVMENVRRTLAGEIRSYQIEQHYAHARGHLVTVLLNVSLVRDSQGQPRYFIAQIQDISERKRGEEELGKAHKELIQTSRLAGMAEVATGILHNVGNVLNSVNVSATLVAEKIKKSRSASLAKVVALLREHQADLGAFITTDVKGKQVPSYLATLSENLDAERAGLLHEVAQLQKNIEHIKDVVAMQQAYAKVSGVLEMVTLDELLEDALRMNAQSLSKHGVEVVREFGHLPAVTVDKHKLLQILVNLVRNAGHACEDSGRQEKRITLRLAGDAECIRISVSDNGVGIPPENLTRIFNHGFTTKKDGHGFGLHSGANAAKGMGGTLTVQSNGAGHGATFTLELPVKPAQRGIVPTGAQGHSSALPTEQDSTGKLNAA